VNGRVRASGAARLRIAAIVAAILTVAAALPAQAQTRPWPSEFPPRPLAARDVKFPAYELRTLANGLQVVAVLHHEQPVVSIRMIVRAGGAQDPRGKLGLANLTASLLDQGTTGKSAREINDEIDFIGGEMTAGAGPDLSFVDMVVTRDSFADGMRLLAEMVRQPAFAQEELERQRQQMLSGLQVSFEDPAFLADAVFNRLVYGFHPYGMPETGTPETLAAVTRDDIVAFHRRSFVPNNAILAVVGDLTADQAFQGVEQVFGDWERRDAPAPPMAAPPNPARRVIVINKPDAVQTEVRVGLLGIRRNQPDYMPLNLAVRILGGEGANRLHQVLRTERGLTYGAQADMHALREAGDVVAETSTRSDATGEVLKLIVREVERIQRERVNERELADAKAYLTGSFPLTIETPDAIATQVLNVLFYGLPIAELQSFRDRVNSVGSADIERVARYYLLSDRLSIVLVGNAAAFTSQLRAAGFGTFDVIDATDLDLTAVDFKRGGRRGALEPPGGPGIAVTAAAPLAYQSRSAAAPARGQATSGTTSDEARALLDKMIAAKGGLDTLRGVKTLRADTRSDLQGPSGPVAAEVTTYLQYPDKVRVETRIPSGAPGAAGAASGQTRLLQVFDGTRGWVFDGRVTSDVPEPALREIRAGFTRDTIMLLLAAHDGAVRARLLPDVKDEDGVQFHALELSSRTLDPVIMYVDRQTNLIAKQTYLGTGPGRPLVEELFTDYRPVDGVQIAFTARVRSGGQPVLDRRVTAIHINQPLEATLFTRPVP
jgi:zinc protease